MRFRYARPERNLGGTTAVREIAKRFDAARLSRRFESASPSFRLDAAAEFASLVARARSLASEDRPRSGPTYR